MSGRSPMSSLKKTTNPTSSMKKASSMKKTATTTKEFSTTDPSSKLRKFLKTFGVFPDQ